MQMKRLGFKDHFAAALRVALKKKYGRPPSTSFVARQFNLRITTNGVSGESVRRWVRGVSLPRCDHMRVLVDWLDLDMDQVIKAGRCPATPETRVHVRVPSRLEQVILSLEPEVQEALVRLVSASPTLFPRRVGV
jgi:hypothetical protein